MQLPTGQILIGAHNWQQFVQPPTVDGEQKGMGLVPRDFGAVPVGGMKGVPVAALPKIPRSEWPERIRDMRAKKATARDIRDRGMNGQRIPTRDQGSQGYCWAHSTVSVAMLRRARDNEPYADLSAYAIACIIKNYRNQGGWNGESMKFIRERGCPTSKTWAQKSKAKSNDNPATWEEAALYKMTEWEDIPQGDFDLQATYSLNGFDYALDLNWWSHSIAGCGVTDGTQLYNDGLLRAETGKLITQHDFDTIWEVNDYGAAFGAEIWNSWGDGWGEGGMGILTESKSRNNGAIAMRVMRAA